MKQRKFIQKTILVACSVAMHPLAWAQVCNPNIPKSTPTEDFILHGNQTVTHKKTGLMWKICPEQYPMKMVDGDPVCSGAIRLNGFESEHVSSINQGAGFAGHKDWRIPNIKEANSIVEVSCHGPSINTKVFPKLVGDTYDYGIVSSTHLYNRPIPKSYGVRKDIREQFLSFQPVSIDLYFGKSYKSGSVLYLVRTVN